MHKRDFEVWLEAGFNPLALRLIKLESDLGDLRETSMAKSDGDRIMDRLDSIAEWVQN